MSDAILLWWGRDIYLYNAGNLTHHPMGERADAVVGIQSALASLSPRPKGVRLVYQPSDLECRAERCPKGSRSLLRKTLGVDIPALQNSELAWAALEPRSITEGGYATLVFNETRARLSRIEAALATKGIRLVGAWPLARVVEAQMAASGADGIGIGIVYIDDHVLIYSSNPVGERDAYVHEGVEAREIGLTDLRKAFSQFEGGRATVLQVGHGEIWNIADVLGEYAVTTASLSDILRATESLKPDEMSCFTALDGQVTPSLIVKVAIVALLAGAAALCYLGFRDRMVANTELGKLTKVRSELRAEVVQLESNKEKAAILNGYMAEAHLDTLHRGQFLESVSRACPPAITLTMIRVSEQGFVVSGNATEGIGQKTGPFFTLLDALTNPQGRLWTVPTESRPEVLQAHDFSVSGRFSRQAPILKPAKN